MYRYKYKTHKKLSIGNALSRTVGILLLLTIFSVWLICGMFAKYATTGESSDSARVAAGGMLELLEHKAEEKPEDSGVYQLLDDVTKENTYGKVLPGVDIPKDPFIRMDLSKAEVDYQLYVKVIQSDPFPDGVTYDLTENWIPTNTENVYQYKTTFDAGSPVTDVKILKNDTLYVSEHYVGNSEGFALKFEAWMKQVD